MAWDGKYDWGSYRFAEASPDGFTAVFKAQPEWRSLLSREFALTYDEERGVGYSDAGQRGPMVRPEQVEDFLAAVRKFTAGGFVRRLFPRVRSGDVTVEPYKSNSPELPQPERVCVAVKHGEGSSFYYFDHEQIRSVDHAFWWWQGHRQEMDREPARQMELGEGERLSYSDRMQAIQEELRRRPTELTTGSAPAIDPASDPDLSL